MNVVDSSCWLEYFADGPNAKHYAAAVKAFDTLVVPTVTLYEVFKVVLREAGENAALLAVTAMQRGVVAELSPALAVSASKLSLRHGLPMADAMILATAREYGAVLLTQDAHFKKIQGVKFYPKT